MGMTAVCVGEVGGGGKEAGREGERGQPTAQNMRTLTSNSFFFSGLSRHFLLNLKKF